MGRLLNRRIFVPLALQGKTGFQLDEINRTAAATA